MTTTTTPTPSDAAMAAAERIKLNYLITLDHPDLYPVPTEQLAAVIDRHFAPLREELARLDAQWQKVVKEVLACDPIPACRRADDQLEPPWEVIARIRASNDKLRAALEEALEAYEDGDGQTLRKVITATLAPERKETT